MSRNRTDVEDELRNLSERLQNEDPECLKDILRLLGARTERALRSRFHSVLNDTDLEDALSIALSRLWLKRSQFDITRVGLDTWFYLLARNVAIDLIRVKKRRHEVEGDIESLAAPLDGPPSIEEPEIRDARQKLLHDLAVAMESLQEVERDVLLNQLSTSEIAESMGVSPNLIRVRRHRSLKKLRELLERMGHEVPESTRKGEQQPHDKTS